ncbi:MAG: alpha-mannosidase, partial [Anaerolineae bacterium]|nr:alpha-mannosidase [Anaerolineae bacterium]
PFRYLKLTNTPADPPISPALDDGDWEKLSWGTYWCEPRENFVLRTRFQVPAQWDANTPIALHLPIGEAGDFSHPEALVYIDGVPYAACDRHHQEVVLPPDLHDGAQHLLALHGWAGTLRNDKDARLLMREGALVQIDQPTRDFVALARVALGIADHLSENEPARAHLYTALDEAFKVLDTREPLAERFYASVPEAYATLRQGIAQAGGPSNVNITAVGHAHIDVAWLWTLDQTRRKAERTFYNVIRLMEQFPEFHFSQSQPQLYDFVRQDHPDLFEQIKQRVLEGRWEPLGGMWVEADCNITGAESLARQLLLGRTFFKEHFGADAEAPVLWLPDVFGFPWSLPQLIKAAGLEYFFTIKIGWNQYNRWPYDSFWWQGLDGTRVLTHFSTTPQQGSPHASTYNAQATPEQVLGTWRNFQQKDCGRGGVTPPLLMAYGYGDGGGGPTREMLENIRVMGEFPATPQIHCGTAKEFFRRLEATVGDRLPTWNGELYLENHRGTYTTQSRNKRANRRNEFLLHDAEFLATLASVINPQYRYPHSALHRAWELMCLNQFHDILPGSSIGPVYAKAQQQYAEIRRIGQQVCDEALSAIADILPGDVLLVNPTAFPRRDLAFWPNPSVESTALRRADGSPIPAQPAAGGFLLDVGELPPYSVTPLVIDSARAGDHPPPASAITATPRTLENDYLRVELDEAGDIVRLYDKLHDREVLPAGAKANQFQAFEDRPINPDAWDIDIFYDDRMWLAEPAASIQVIESGPLRATLEMRRRILNSEYTQRISLAYNSPRLDFDTTIQWRERHILLKVSFPVDVLAPQATYEIQWGNIQRPTHRNTSWDWARFETCAHKWVDLSEGGYGVSLLNDCKYGHDIHGNTIRLSLLRSPTIPDPEADQGEHRFAYSLLPHHGPWDESTVAAAYALNDPIIVWSATRGIKPDVQRNMRPVSFLGTDQPNVVIETIKQAEDGQGIIVRLYENQRKRGEFTLTTAFPLAAAWRTNLLEENSERLEVEDHRLRCSIKPYQIVTLRLLPQ